jgi:dihydrofolate synthase/folylpolyglutamate synthase
VNQALAYLNRLKGWVGQRDFSLERIRKVAQSLGNPQDNFKSVLIAGTNGKGSTAKVLSSILLAAGYRIGLYTSPHLSKINERIQIDSKDIDDELLSEYVLRVNSAMQTCDTALSQFEVLTLISFLVFSDLKLDYGVIEVGLGGRLDATNIISKPDISIISSISYDHQDILGFTLGEIAAEKAGIIKNGTVLLLGLLPVEARDVISRKSEEAIQVSEINRDFSASAVSQDSILQRIDYTDSIGRLDLKSSLLGQHQLNNIALAVRAARYLKVENAAIVRGVQDARWPARLESINYKGINILIDSAHNLDGASALRSYINQINFVPDVVVFGALRTKDWKSMLSSWESKIKQWFILEPESDMALNEAEIGRFISKHELGETFLFGRSYDKLLSQIADLPQNTNVLLFGSIYLVGILREKLIKN